MKQIIEEVFEAEKKANEIVKQARDKASEIRQAAEKENLEKMAEARMKAKDIVHAEIENAEKEAELFRQEKLKQSDGEKESILGNTSVLNNLIGKICKIIITTDDDK